MNVSVNACNFTPWLVRTSVRLAEPMETVSLCQFSPLGARRMRIGALNNRDFRAFPHFSRSPAARGCRSSEQTRCVERETYVVFRKRRRCGAGTGHIVEFGVMNVV